MIVLVSLKAGCAVLTVTFKSVLKCSPSLFLGCPPESTDGAIEKLDNAEAACLPSTSSSSPEVLQSDGKIIFRIMSILVSLCIIHIIFLFMEGKEYVNFIIMR